MQIKFYTLIITSLVTCMPASVEVDRTICEDTSFGLIIWSSAMIQQTDNKDDYREYEDLLLLGLYDYSTGCKDRYLARRERIEKKLSL